MENLSEFYLTSLDRISANSAQDWLTPTISASPLLLSASAFPAVTDSSGVCPLCQLSQLFQQFPRSSDFLRGRQLSPLHWPSSVKAAWAQTSATLVLLATAIPPQASLHLSVCIPELSLLLGCSISPIDFPLENFSP